MSLGYLEVFQIASDCFQVLLAAAAVLLLMRYRKNSNKPDWPSWPASEGTPFMHEFLLQSLKHRSEQSFDSVQRILQTERTNLMQLFEIGEGHWDDRPSVPALDDSDPEPFQIGEADPAENIDKTGNQYQQVRQLAAAGMSVPRIAKQLGIPRGEVELVLKMTISSQKKLYRTNPIEAVVESEGCASRR